MKRYPAYDPPEYVRWEADPALVEAYRLRVEAAPERSEVVRDLDAGSLLSLYRGLVRFRLHDIALKRWVKQGTISKAWLGTGEEAVTVGAVQALRRGPGGDVVAPMIRNAGACHEMGVPISDLFRAYLGTADGPTAGRDLHLGDPERGVVAPVSMVGSVATVVNGYALAFRQRGEDRVGLTWIGDGSTKTGEVHEALNLAAVRRLPVVFVVQNNQVALGTAVARHHRANGFAGLGPAYGMSVHEVDGNNVLDVHAASVLAVRACRAGEGPVMIAAETFRMGGHATHDEREARRLMSPRLFESWGRRDPIGLYEEYLAELPYRLPADPEVDSIPADVNVEAWNRAVLARLEDEVREEVEEGARAALWSRDDAVPEPGSHEIAACYGDADGVGRSSTSVETSGVPSSRAAAASSRPLNVDPSSGRAE